MDFFRFSDYDCIGFDLDSTIIHYNIENLAQLEYKVITDFLVDKKDYDPDIFKDPLTDKDLDFLQKGLIVDFEQGNLVKLSHDGKVQRASHGTSLLSARDIEKYYPNREWPPGTELRENPISLYGHLSARMRPLLNCFDITGGLVFAQIVDSVDKEGDEPRDHYDIWPDIAEAFSFMYKREQLRNGEGNFYPEVRAHPGRYIHKCSPDVLAWLREIRRTRRTFLVTGSNSDFVEVTAGYALGEDVRSLFDLVVCYGQKPGFFTQGRPFYSVRRGYEDAIVGGAELQPGQIYNRGNWRELREFLGRLASTESPRCLYVGDNLLQDVYAPSEFTDCDALLVSDEQLAEGILHHDLLRHEHEGVVNSGLWGSFFAARTGDGLEDTFWNYIAKRHAKICAPNLEVFCGKSLDEPIRCFKREGEDGELSGYYPEKPVSLVL